MESLVTILCAMRAEAEPIIAGLGLEPAEPGWNAAWPVRCWRHPAEPVTLVVNGTDARTGVDLIGTTPAVLATLAVVGHLRPRAILVAGAAGGHSERTAIGRVHLVDRAFHHDRRIPLAGFDACGIGPEPLHHSGALAEAFGVGMASISTGNSLDTLPGELAFFERHAVTLKDMETASVAWTAAHAGTRVVALRAVTDFFDHPTPEHQFLANFDAAVTNLAACVGRGLPGLLEACGSDAWA
jgi:5'-methylthioadenosine nucleosidase